MRQTLRSAAALAVAVSAFASTIHAGPITGGNLVIARIGDGSTALDSSGFQIELQEMKTGGGAVVQGIALPTTTSAPNFRVTLSGDNAFEGQLLRSVDGNYLTLAGYNAAVGTPSVSGAAAPNNNRTIARINAGGVIDTSTSLDGTANFTGGIGIRSAITTNGTDFWASGNGAPGSTAGVRHFTLGATSATQLSTTPTNCRHLGIFGGQLYCSSSSPRMFTVGTGTPTTGGQTSLPLFGDTGSIPSPNGFFFDGANTFYVADDSSPGPGGGLRKYTYVLGVWTHAYTLNTGLANGCRAVTGQDEGGTFVLYAVTSATSANSIVRVADTGASAPFTTLATAGANYIYRGIALAPGADTTAPSVTLASVAPSVTNAPIPITITFDESMNGFDPATEINVTNGTITASAGSGSSYTATITPSGQGAVSATINAGVGMDAATNGNLVSNTLNWTFDSVPPVPVLSSGDGATTNTAPLHLSINFGESVTGFDPSTEVFITGGTNAGGGTGTGAAYNALITPAGDGVVTAQVLANVATDAAAQNNTASLVRQWIYDTTPPTSGFATPVPAYGIGGTINLNWTSSDATTFVADLQHFYRKTGSWISASSLTPVASGTLNFAPPSGSGRYFFITSARDDAWNAQVEPAGTTNPPGTVAFMWNATANGVMQLPFAVGTAPVITFPMEMTPFAGADVDLGTVTSLGLLTVLRTESNSAPPGGYDASLLMDEVTAITAGSGLAFNPTPGAAITLHYQESNLGGMLEGQINRVFRDTAGVVTAIIPDLVDTSANTVTFRTSGFSSFYIGNAAAAPGGVADWMRND